MTSVAEAREREEQEAAESKVPGTEQGKEDNHAAEKEKAQAPAKKQAEKKTAAKKASSEKGSDGLKAEKSETKDVPLNMRVTESTKRKLEKLKKQGGFRSTNAAVEAIIEDYFSKHPVD